ncbi:MAG: adenosylcobinamide-GDP ribazoletransferase [Rhodobacteraceae bacterium]|nr:adenosylcobinamide-GDP ribazoletransferase [Paracoccaceae bacterium]
MHNQETPTVFERIRNDISTALGLLTIVPAWRHPERGKVASSAWCWPLIGALVGAVAGLAGYVASAVGLAPGIAAALAVALAIATTGGLHEDGLADTADGLLGGRNKASRLRIMHDSRIGTFGALALFIVLVLRWSAISELVAEWRIVACMAVAGAFSRMVMVAAMHFVPTVDSSGLSGRAGKPSRKAMWIGGATTLGSMAAINSSQILTVLALGAIPAIALLYLARKRVGGQTGDVLGASQQATEASVLVALSTS